jgi:hypothetical protein
MAVTLTEPMKRSIITRACDALCMLQTEVNKIEYQANHQPLFVNEAYPAVHAAEFKTHLCTKILWMGDRSYKSALPILVDWKTKNEDNNNNMQPRESMNDFLKELKEMQCALSSDLVKGGYKEFVDKQISEALIDIITRKLGVDCTVPIGSKEHVAMLDPLKISEACTEVEALQQLVECQSFLNMYLVVACE